MSLHEGQQHPSGRKMARLPSRKQSWSLSGSRRISRLIRPPRLSLLTLEVGVLRLISVTSEPMR